MNNVHYTSYYMNVVHKDQYPLEFINKLFTYFKCLSGIV